MIPTLTDWMFRVTDALLAPVLIALTAMSAAVLFLFGGFVREVWERRAIRRRLRAALDLARLKPAPIESVIAELAAARCGLPARFARAVSAASDGVEADKALGDLSNDVSGALAVLSFFTRLGPMGGLMATLIPLGPALNGLAQGNLAELAANLTIAFTATVIGLLVSCFAYGMGAVRRSWYTRDMDDLEHIADRVFRPAEDRP